MSQSGRNGAALPLLFAVGVWLVLQIVPVLNGVSPVAQGLLLDVDSYMKLARIHHLLASGDWFDGRIPRSNAPFGETQHWTRLFDLIVIFGAALLRPFMTLGDAVFWSGALVSPLLNLALLFAIMWAARPLLGEKSIEALVVAAVLTLVQPAIFSYSLPGRAYHRVLLMLIFAILVGAALRALASGSSDPKKAQRYALIGGSAAGIGVWAGVELLLAAGAAAAALGLAWVLRGRPWLRVNLAYAASFAASAAAALVIERPWTEYLAAESDRISAMQLAAAGALVAVWCVIAAAARVPASREGPLARAIGAALATTPALAILLLAFPDLLSGPIGAVDPRTRAIWFDKVEEMRPLWPRTPEDAIMLLKLMGVGAAAVPLLAWLLAAERRAPAFLPRLGMALVLVAVLPVALAHQRFTPYAEVLFGMIVAEGLRRVFARANAARNPLRRALLRVLPPVAVFLGPILLGATLASSAGQPAADPDAVHRTCSVTRIAGVLAGFEWSGRPQTILATIELGPELLYRTPHRVIGTPYQRNADGIYDSYAALAEEEPAAKPIFAKRKIDLILLCPSIDKVFFDDPPRSASLYNRLLRGDVPNWIERLTLPADIADTFQLYRVRDR